MLRGYFQRIFKNYQKEKTNDFIDNSIVRLIQEDIPTYLNEFIHNPDNYAFKGNAGKGAFTEAPYIAIMDKEITDQVGKGYYVIYIFSKDTNRLYLSLNQAIRGGNWSDNQGAFRSLKAQASRYRHYLSETPSNFPLKTLSLGNPSYLNRYEVGNVYGKEYTLDNLPSEEELESDLDELLDLYSKLKNKVPKVWKITPGSSRIEDQKNLWPLLEKEGYIGIGWLHDSQSYTEFQTIDELKDALIKFHPNYKDKDPTQAARMVWDFTHNLKEGDIIVANKGLGTVRGIGIVKSGYIGPKDPENPGIFNYFWHLRKVDWKITDELELEQSLFDIKTVTEIKETKWNDIKQAYLTKNQDYLPIFNEIESTRYIKDGESDEINVRDSLEIIFKELPLAKKRGEKPKKHDVGRAFSNIRDAIFEIAISIHPDKSYNSTAYYQAYGNWYKLPYVYIEDQANKDKFGHWDQHYVGFWFKEDLDGVYLSLQQGGNYATNLLGKKLGEYSEEDLKNYLNDHAKQIKEQLKDSVGLEKFIEESMLTAFSDKTIYGKYYDKKNLPSNDQIISDFKKLFTLYSTLKPDEDGPTPPEITFFEYLAKKGYFFDYKLVENFLLSLKVKPFVILTGNSGTGKTKLSQLFAQYLNLKNRTHSFKEIYNEALSFKRTVTTYSRKHGGGWRLKENEVEALLNSFNANEINELPEDLNLGIYRQEQKIKGTGYLKEVKQSYSEIPQIYLYYDKDLPFYNKLGDMSGELEIHILKKDYEPIHNQRHEIVPVGANWTENRHIIGFYNVITEKYQGTEALDLILSASDDINEPYFLVLDEMNLSHVERYFSDFLSAMESEEDIELHQAITDEAKDEQHQLPPRKMKLSENLMVVGTVNIDETTYMFSPKVLDRANTLEFLTQSAEAYMSGSPEYSVTGDLDYLQNPLSDVDIKNEVNIRTENIMQLHNRLNGVKTGDNQELWGVLSRNIGQFQGILKDADFDFGFRTINEIIRFMYVAWQYEHRPNQWENWERYFDAQIMQKMLPKLHGSQKELSKVLEILEQKCAKGNFPSSTEKIKWMRKTLKDKRYVSFTG